MLDRKAVVNRLIVPGPERARRPGTVMRLGAVLSLGLTVSLGSVSFQALAGSPEFAYTAEKWASLRDNRLEFEEIADLVHEYNNTVIQNQIEYNDYRGETKDDISQDYYDAADDIDGNLNYPDSGDENYASGLASYLSGQIQADNLREQGDDNVEDGDIKKLGYDQAERSLVKQAQELMISYWSQRYSLESLQAAREQAESAYKTVLTKQSAGLANQAQLLSAEKEVASAAASLLSAESGLAETKENLCLMLGWTYGSEVEIGEIPEPDLVSVSAIDLEADVEKGLGASYELKILEKKAANAQSGSRKESLNEDLRNARETAAANIQAAYRNLLLAKSDYEQADQAYSIEKNTMDTAARRLQAGTITRNDYAAQQSSCTTAGVNVLTKKLALLEAQLEYTWSVNGLASTSA